jgi:hypothetical protein
MNGMDEQQRKINERMARPKPLVSDEEVKAAEDMLRRLCEAAGREPPIPAVFIRHMLEEAAMTRTGMFSFSNGVRAGEPK